ncbi:hypothetical protein TNCV_4106151 [Trichonephila clavipes]|nr:hypothetical protein TNCV_4106151 [Trichonephila clavipes]
MSGFDARASEYTRSTFSLNQWVRKSCELNHECRELGRIFPSLSVPCPNCGDGNRWCRHLSSLWEFRRANSYCHPYGAQGEGQRQVYF